MIKIGEGAASEAFLTEDGFVLLVGKRSDSFNTYQKLKVSLELLDGKIKSLNIPNNASTIEPYDTYPFGALKFSLVPGTELKKKIADCSDQQKTAIGKKLAEFIFEMQNIDTTLNKEKEIEINNNKFKNSLELIAPYLPNDENDQLQKVAKLYNEFMLNSKFCITHGDLQEENLLVDEKNNLVGIVDFGNMEYYVSEIEFFPMMDFDTIIFNSMIENYRGQIDVNNITLVGLVRHVRFFKHVVGRGEHAIAEELKRIRRLLNSLHV